MPLIGMAGSSVMMLPATDALKKAIEIDYRAFELLGQFPQCICDQVEKSARLEMKRLAEDADVRLSVHAPFLSLNIATPNPGIREESVKQVTDALELCADIGGNTVIVHNGLHIVSKDFRDKTPQLVAYQWELNIQSLKTIAGRAKDLGVTVCLENIGFETELLDQCVDDLIRIKDAVGSPALAFCLDIGHARLNGELDEAIEKMGPFVKHIHFADNFGEADDHLTIGEGNFDYSKHLDFFINFQYDITLEVQHIGTDDTAARKSKDYVERLFGMR